MVPDATGRLPEIANNKTALGVVEMLNEEDGNGDILVVDGMVRPDRHGMSVSPSPDYLPLHRIPKRLKQVVPIDLGIPRGKNTLVCWRTGEGAFADSRFDVGLLFHLDPDNANHGLVGPDAVVALADYRAALGKTHPNWTLVPWPWEES
jgi:hypothetical protein